VGRGHAVDHGKDFEFRFEFVRQRIEYQVCIANRISDRRCKEQCAGQGVNVNLIACRTQVGGQDIFEGRDETGLATDSCQAPAQWSGADDSDAFDGE
jgi:hypothetical protein